MRYLGIPLSPRRLRNSDYQSLINRMTDKIQGWGAKHRSYAGTLKLVKSMLLSIQRFWSYVFPIPVGVAKRVEGICRSYLWSGTINSRKSLVAWRRVCQTFRNGGLQIKEVLGWNRSIIGLMVVKLVQANRRDTIWTAWIKAYKLRQGGTMQVTCKQTDLVWWKALLHMRDLMVRKMPGFENQLPGLPGPQIT